MRTLKADPTTVRAQNRRLVLDYLRTQGGMSRVQLAEASGLSTASITAVTAELIKDGWVIERGIGMAGTSGGRRPIVLDIDYEAHFAIGVKVRPDRIDAALTDLATRVLERDWEPLDHTAPEEVSRRLSALCSRLLERRGLHIHQLLGVGLAISGIVDFAKGTAVHAPLLGWRDVPIADIVSQHLGVPVWTDNDVNAFAVAEHLFGQGKLHKNFLVITIGRGVGAAFVLESSVYRGRGGSGEFGHNLVVPNGQLCGCGQRGCLEAYTSELAVTRQYAELRPELGEVTSDLVAQHAREGDEDAARILHDAGTLVGLHTSYLVNTLDPELIIFGGEAVRLGEPYLGPLQATIRDHAFSGRARNLTFVVNPWFDDTFTPWLRGAASLAVQRAFDLGIV